MDKLTKKQVAEDLEIRRQAVYHLGIGEFTPANVAAYYEKYADNLLADASAMEKHAAELFGKAAAIRQYHGITEAQS